MGSTDSPCHGPFAPAAHRGVKSGDHVRRAAPAWHDPDVPHRLLPGVRGHPVAAEQLGGALRAGVLPGPGRHLRDRAVPADGGGAHPALPARPALPGEVRHLVLQLPARRHGGVVRLRRRGQSEMSVGARAVQHRDRPAVTAVRLRRGPADRHLLGAAQEQDLRSYRHLRRLHRTVDSQLLSGADPDGVRAARARLAGRRPVLAAVSRTRRGAGPSWWIFSSTCGSP